MRQSGAGASVFAILKYLLLAVFVGLLVRQYTGTRTSQTTFAEMEQAVVSSAALDPMTKADNQMIRRLYQLDPEEYEGFTLYYPTSSMGVEELLLVKLSDASQAQALTEAIERRVSSQISSFEGYGPTQVDMLEHSITEAKGGFVLLVVAEAPEAVRQAFENAL